MTSGRAEGACPCLLRRHRNRLNETAAVRLSIVLNEFQTIPGTNLPYPVGIGTTTIEMDYHEGFRPLCDGLLDKRVVDLQSIDGRLDKHRFQAILRDGKNRGDICVGRYDDLIALHHHAQLHIGPEDERQGIEAVATADAVARADILCIMLLKLPRGLSLEIPSALQHLVGSMLVGRIDLFQIQVFHHKSYSYQS